MKSSRVRKSQLPKVMMVKAWVISGLRVLMKTPPTVDILQSQQNVEEEQTSVEETTADEGGMLSTVVLMYACIDCYEFCFKLAVLYILRHNEKVCCCYVATRSTPP